MFSETDPRPKVLTHPNPTDTEVIEYEYNPGNGTRYHGWCVRLQDGRTLIAVEPTRGPEGRFARSWYVFRERPGDYLSWDYMRDKLLPAEGDMWAIQRFVAFMLDVRFSEAPMGERP